MKYIQEFVDEVEEELNGAKDYAEKYLMYKYEGNANRSKIFQQMASQELEHSKLIHDILVEEINKLKSQGFQPPERMMEEWEHVHVEFIEKNAWIRQMLAM